MHIGKSPHNEDQEAFLPKAIEDGALPNENSHKAASPVMKYARLALEIIMGIAIVALFLRPFPERKASKSSPVPEFPRKTYTFLENSRYLHDDMFFDTLETLHTLHNWIELSADGRGYVQVNNSQSFDLGEPYEIKDHFRTEPVYMMSVFHQLHCLSYIVEHFQSGFSGVELTGEIAHHSAHCFDYLRQSILCAADTSLEGKTEAGPGWGSKHECKDYDAVLAWANEHTVVKWRGNMPDTAVL
ncbi:hypothetical protein F5884DRAFT_801584 [Xylogone sp. PMI_703]|nr:hypothetical protein F5884DRAFT_801584 [Xylogone sp. PMI_703]